MVSSYPKLSIMPSRQVALASIKLKVKYGIFLLLFQLTQPAILVCCLLTACACNVPGALDQICNPITGQCNCRTGRTNRQCDACLTNFYPDPAGSGVCLPCLCSPTGSTSLQCNTNGFCTCIPGVTGMRCDACNCDLRNTVNGDSTCVMPDGQCNCRPQATGTKCTTCTAGNFLDALTGCQRKYTV